MGSGQLHPSLPYPMGRDSAPIAALRAWGEPAKDVQAHLECQPKNFYPLPSPPLLSSPPLTSGAGKAGRRQRRLSDYRRLLAALGLADDAMGIKGLTKLLAEHAPRAATLRRVEDYRGRVIAIDASLSIYQFLVSQFTAPMSEAQITRSLEAYIM
ncbi:hypothetical protein ACQ4PT_002400 [Festuca glaucescens]